MSLDLVLSPPLAAAWSAPVASTPSGADRPALAERPATRRTVAQSIAALLDDADALVCRFEVDDAADHVRLQRRR
jgi:hypothetical protein